MRKKLTLIFLAACFLLSLTMTACAAESTSETSANGTQAPETGEQALPFADVAPDAWYAVAVTYCYQNGIFTGTSAVTFSPDTTLSRAMLATILYRMAGSPSLENEILGYPFADVPGDLWCADAIYWARAEGIINGYANNTFLPNASVTRQQAVTILWRYAGSPQASAGHFSDDSDISDWARTAAGWALSAGLLTGWADSTLQPQSALTRAEAAVLLARYLSGQ